MQFVLKFIFLVVKLVYTFLKVGFLDLNNQIIETIKKLENKNNKVDFTNF